MIALGSLAATAGDRMSPILVKELRQGLRATTFTGAFVLIHLVMIASVLLAVGVTPSRYWDPAASLFWGTIWLWSVIILPARAYGELRRELRDRTLELTFLTRLTAWRTIQGKWLSVFLQTVLVISAVLPYAVLRYFVGRVDLVMDMTGLALVLLTSGVATALMLLAAACQSWMLNIAFAVGAVFLLPWGAWGLLMAMSTPLRSLVGRSAMPLNGVAAVLAAVMTTGFLLELAASRIAPAAENHALRKRALALGALLFAAFVAPSGDPGWMGAASAVVLFTCMDAVCERPLTLRTLYLPFARRGAPGRLLGRLFYPGWPSGMLFTAVALAGLALYWSRLGMTPRAVHAIALALPAFVLFPLAITQLLAPRTQRRWTWYGAAQLGGGFAAILWLIMASVVSRSPDVECVCPTIALLASMRSTSAAVAAPCRSANALALLAMVGFLCLHQRAAWRELSAAERRAAAPDAG